jgi:hypothetical protein
MLVDKNAHHRNRPVVLKPAVFFGQLQHILTVRLGASKTLKLNQPTTLILAAIRSCSNPQLMNNGIYYYKREGHLEVVDVKCIQCLIGRVVDRGQWAIVDHSKDAARPSFELE